MTGLALDAQAAPGTDPQRLAAAVALAARPGGSVRLDRALSEGRPLPRPTPDDVAEVRRIAAAWSQHGVRAALRGDPAWPSLRCSDPPPLLAWRGELPAADRPVVALVGARRATGYGRGVAAWIAEAVGAAGAVVVSGGAMFFSANSRTMSRIIRWSSVRLKSTTSSVNN